jgi:hypothetical protein
MRQLPASALKAALFAAVLLIPLSPDARAQFCTYTCSNTQAYYSYNGDYKQLQVKTEADCDNGIVLCDFIIGQLTVWGGPSLGSGYVLERYCNKYDATLCAGIKNVSISTTDDPKTAWPGYSVYWWTLTVYTNCNANDTNCPPTTCTSQPCSLGPTAF